jgi:mono/diheme cytochrome c family protein
MAHLRLTSLLLLVSSTVSLAQPGNDALESSIKRGMTIYNDNCLSCHMEDGSGGQLLNPPLINSKTIQGEKSRLIRIILDGMNEPIEIDGVIYRSPMPDLKYLSDQQIADVLTYIRSSFENRATPISREEVAVERKRPK